MKRLKSDNTKWKKFKHSKIQAKSAWNIASRQAKSDLYIFYILSTYLFIYCISIY